MTKSLLVLATAFLCTNASADTDKYKIDPAHTSVVFKVGHLGFSHVYGMFPGVEGTFSIDEAKPESAKIDFKIKADSIQTNVGKRDDHLKSPDFFNVKAHPWITFKSKSVKKTGADTYRIEGNVTLNGVTKPLAFDFKRNRTGKGMQGETRTGGDANFTIKRSDFKMNYMNAPDQVSDSVELFVSIEAIRE